jgi:hypothetical protein
MRRSVKATTNRKMVSATAALVLLSLSAPALCAQAASSASSTRTTDIAISYTAEHANPVGGGGNFWLQGGSAELGVSLWHGLGVAGNFTGVHSSSVGSQNVPLGLLVYTFGPRYRWMLPTQGRQTSIFGEALFGVVRGFDSLFPTSTGATNTASALAVQVGLGFDVKLKKHFDLRPVEASWVRMQLPNSASNVQNDLRLSTGIVLRY